MEAGTVQQGSEKLTVVLRVIIQGEMHHSSFSFRPVRALLRDASNGLTCGVDSGGQPKVIESFPALYQCSPAMANLILQLLPLSLLLYCKNSNTEWKSLEELLEVLFEKHCLST